MGALAENPLSPKKQASAKAILKLLKKHKKAWKKKWVKAQRFAARGLTAKQITGRIDRGTLKAPKKLKPKKKPKKKKKAVRKPAHVSKIASGLLKKKEARTWASAMRKAGRIRRPLMKAYLKAKKKKKKKKKK